MIDGDRPGWQSGPAVAIHPAIRVITLVVFALMMSRADLLQMFPALLLLSVIYISQDVSVRRAAATMLYRMRWFFLSLLLVYACLTPDPVSGEVFRWAWPAANGVKAGARQVIALSLIILAVNLLLALSRREELLQAIYWLARPLTGLGLSRERLAMRLVLVLDRVADVREQAGQVLDVQKPGAGHYWTTVSHVAATMFRQTLERAETMADEEIIFQPLSAPPWYQWGLPVVLIPCLFLLSL